MRATLLESNPDFALMLPCAFEVVGIPLRVVGTLAGLHHALCHAALDDFVIVDCSLDRSEDKVRCVEVVQRAALDVYVIANPAARDFAEFRRRLEREARCNLKWLPTTVGLVEILNILRSVRQQAFAARVSARPLTSRQQCVWALVAKEQSHAEIAAALGISVGTVKRHVERIKDKLGASSSSELKSAYRWINLRG